LISSLGWLKVVLFGIEKCKPSTPDVF